MKVVQIQLSLKRLVLGLVEVAHHPSLGKDLGLINQEFLSAGRPSDDVAFTDGMRFFQHLVELDGERFLVGLARH